MYGSASTFNSNRKLYIMSFIILTFSVFSCGKDSGEQELQNVPISQQIDNLILALEKGQEINQKDRNRIYNLASDLNQKYKGEMESDEIIKVIED